MKETEYGSIADDWDFIQSSNYCSNIVDGTHDSPKRVDNGRFLITSKHIKGRDIDFENAYQISQEDFAKVNERSKVDQWDVIISMIGEYCGFCYVERSPTIDYAVKNVGIFKTGCRSRALWLYFFLNSPMGNFILETNRGGTSQPYLALGALRNLPIVYPKTEREAEAIAAVLSSLDDKIDLLHRQNKTLEAMAETLFRQWFVEEADEGWEEGTFEQWIIETVGGEWGKENIEGDYTKAVNCIRGTDIADLNIGIPSKTPVRFVKEKKYESICPNKGDIILEISGGTENQSTGRTCYINLQIEKLFIYPLVFSNFCRLIRVKKQEYSYFLYCYFQYLYKQDEFFSLENGSSGIKNLNYKVLLYELLYPMPDEKKVIEFHYHVIQLFQKIDQNKHQIRTLEKLRDTLLPKLMSGEVRVKV